MKATRQHASKQNPDEIKLSTRQAERLAKISDVNVKELVGLTVAEISEKFRFRIDPELLFFRKVCGKVVKKNPATGVEYPVPFATVHVEDTDCSLLGFFPDGHRWGWYFPFHCRREEIATVKTDECGNFCVWVPRWDIDWVLRFRAERHCYPIIFERPSIRDILGELFPEKIPFPIPEPYPPFRPKPGPGPDPAPFEHFDRSSLLQVLENNLGKDVSGSLGRLLTPARFGANTREMSAAFDANAFEQIVPPPLPPELHIHSTGRDVTQHVDMEVARSTLATRLKFDVGELSGLNLHNFVGPFKRCYDVLVPEWVPIFDVPDITFRVTQDTDGDGDEETIYSEGYFQVRWDSSGPIADLKIYARPNARAGMLCVDVPVPCSDTPAIVLAGYMPVADAPTIYNPATGYALRTNRPHILGTMPDPMVNPYEASAPFWGTIHLLGCLNNSATPTPTHFRVVYEYSANGGATYTNPAPFLNVQWNLYRLHNGHLQTATRVPDSNGWYEIDLHDDPSNRFMPQDVLFEWNTTQHADGRYRVHVEVGTGGVASESSADVAFNVNNASPLGPMSVEWRIAGTSAYHPLTYPCPLVRRGVNPADLEFHVTLQASATHLRSAELFASGCGGGDFGVLPGGTTSHWHQNAGDNSVTLDATFTLPHTTLEGTYSFSGLVISRAMNPMGFDGGQLLPIPWEYDTQNIYINPSFSFSVINAS
jgi:hypothetical protein